MKIMRSLAAVGAVIATLVAGSAHAAQTNVAVAANFTGAAKEIAAAFKAKTGDEAMLSFGSTGKLYTQISQDAPFDIFLAADQARPKKTIADGLGVSDSLFTYAVGRLVLWSRNADLVTGKDTLKTAKFDKLSICNPIAAPYGAASVEVMKALGVYGALRLKLVVGANVSQAFQFVDTGNAEIGFVALSQLAGNESGSKWIVPQDLYTPIRQDAVLLKRGSDNPAAKAFVAFLKGPEAKAIIEKYGYAFGPGN